jgi:hypothetical protein
MTEQRNMKGNGLAFLSPTATNIKAWGEGEAGTPGKASPGIGSLKGSNIVIRLFVPFRDGS